MRQLSEEEQSILEQLPGNVSGVDNTPEAPAPAEAAPATEVPAETPKQEMSEKEQLAALIGQRVGYKQKESMQEENLQALAERRNMTVGQNIFQNAEIAEGWQYFDRELLGERNKFYPADWQFRVRPATVEAIRNWSTIDDENANVVDDVFNEIIKSCLKIITPMGPIPVTNLRSWDRFFFLLVIRQYTFANGETNIKYDEECPECENPVPFVLDSSTLEYELPDPDIMHYYDQTSCTWMVDPTEYDVEGEPFTLYLPTLEKEANIKAWIISRIQNNKKVDNVFIKFLPWMANKISKNLDVATRQIKELENKFKDLDADMFGFMNEVIDNIAITPSTKMTSKCPTCGEEVVANIRFPKGVSALFDFASGRKKFGKK